MKLIRTWKSAVGQVLAFTDNKTLVMKFSGSPHTRRLELLPNESALSLANTEFISYIIFNKLCAFAWVEVYPS